MHYMRFWATHLCRRAELSMLQSRTETTVCTILSLSGVILRHPDSLWSLTSSREYAWLLNIDISSSHDALLAIAKAVRDGDVKLSTRAPVDDVTISHDVTFATTFLRHRTTTQQEHKRCGKQVGPGTLPESGARLGSSHPPLSFQVNLRLEMGHFQVPRVWPPGRAVWVPAGL